MGDSPLYRQNLQNAEEAARGMNEIFSAMHDTMSMQDSTSMMQFLDPQGTTLHEKEEAGETIFNPESVESFRKKLTQFLAELAEIPPIFTNVLSEIQKINQDIDSRFKDINSLQIHLHEFSLEHERKLQQEAKAQTESNKSDLQKEQISSPADENIKTEEEPKINESAWPTEHVENLEKLEKMKADLEQRSRDRLNEMVSLLEKVSSYWRLLDQRVAAHEDITCLYPSQAKQALRHMMHFPMTSYGGGAMSFGSGGQYGGGSGEAYVCSKKRMPPRRGLT
eukprot:GHVP01000145.1.p1 GENE.GHVP01000145.1~~GHVP01000145.1.p1  ORF type:complete len:308 (+),score=69.31 GHVP01000145.1:87-926(+)